MDSFSTKRLQVRTCLQTQNMIRERFEDVFKRSIEFLPSIQQCGATAEKFLNRKIKAIMAAFEWGARG